MDDTGDERASNISTRDRANQASRDVFLDFYSMRGARLSITRNNALRRRNRHSNRLCFLRRSS
jgi:hypothetical protein